MYIVDRRSCNVGVTLECTQRRHSVTGKSSGQNAAIARRFPLYSREIVQWRFAGLLANESYPVLTFIPIDDRRFQFRIASMAELAC